MKKSFAFLLVTLMLMVLVKKHIMAQDALTQTYTAADKSLSIQYPDGWKLNPANGGVYLQNKDGLVSVLIALFPAGIVTSPKDALRMGNPKAKLDTATSLTLEGRQAARLDSQDGNRTHITIAIIFKNGKVLFFDGSAGSNIFKQYEVTLLAIATSAQSPAGSGTPSTTSSTANTQADLQPITLTDVDKLKQIATLDVASDAGQSGVNSVAFSPDGKTLAAGAGNTIDLVDIATGKVLTTAQGHTDIILSLAFSPDGKMLASGSQDQTVRLWDVTTGKVLKTFKVDSGYPRSRIAFSPDGKMLAEGNYGPLQMWDTASGKALTKIKATGGDAGINNVAFNPDGKLLATAGGDYNVQLWQVATGKLTATLKGHKGNVNSVAFSPDGKTLASSSSDKTIHLWDVATHKPLSTLEGQLSGVTSVAFSADGTVLASSGDDSQIILWDVASGKLLTILQKFVGFSNVVFSKDGTMLAFSDSKGTVEVWGVAAGAA